MRNVWQMVGCAGLVVGLCGAAAAQEVKIWVPSPVRATVPQVQAPVNSATVNLISVVALADQHRCRVSNDFGSDFRYGGCRTTLYPTRYPF
jgi:hypothetical protein